MKLPFRLRRKITQLCLLILGGGTLIAQDSARFAQKANKSMLTAGVLAYVIPGMGHVYAERPARAIGFFAGETALIGALFIGNFRSGDDHQSDYPTGVNVALWGSLIATRVWEYIDLFECIDEHNLNAVAVGIIPNGHRSFALSVQVKF